jgi:imidazole glycerol-phosphate synthase subunit HisF
MEKKMFYGATSNSFEKARWLREKTTRHENLLWGRLQKRQILALRIKRQHPIGTYIADFYCHAAKLVIEVDGMSHNTIHQKAYDEERTFNFEIDGLKVIRFTNDEIEFYLDRVIKEITTHVLERISPNRV